MNEKTIKIDPEVLTAEIEKLKGLIEDEELSKKVGKLLIALEGSSGESVSQLKSISSDLYIIVKAMDTLFSRTVEFLENAHTNFVDTEGFAVSQLRKEVS